MLSIVAVLIILWVEIVETVVVAAAAAAALAIAELIDRIVALMDVVRHDNDVVVAAAVALCYNLFLVLGDTQSARLDYSVYCDSQTVMVNY